MHVLPAVPVPGTARAVMCVELNKRRWKKPISLPTPIQYVWLCVT